MIKAIIVDDEEKNVLVLNKLLKDYCTNVAIAGTAKNIVEAKKMIDATKPQLVFLDIEMPNGSGFDLLNAIEEINFEIIFVTAYSQYAIDAFRYSSVDYLLKPININHLKDAIKKAEQRILDKQAAINYKTLLQQLDKDNPLNQKVLLSGSNEQFVIKANEILYCIAERSYTIVIMTNNRKFMSSKNLKYYEDILPKNIFYRVHHGHLININYIQRITKGQVGTVVMNDEKELEIAVRRRDDFFKMIK